MRIASRFQRSGRSNDRLDRALALGIGLGLVSFGCFFELPELEEPDGGIGGGGFSGIAGDGGGEPAPGGNGGSGSGGAQTFPPCNALGQKFCDGACVPVGPENGCSNPDCAACPSLPNAAAPTCGGDSNRCQITACNADFADCDGDLLAYNNGEGITDSTSRGCEYSFGTIAEATQPLVAPKAVIRLDDNGRDDWNGIPAYRVEKTCVDCNDNGTPFDPTAQNEAPPSTDLSAYFRVAWDLNSFYVLAEAFDDRVFDQGSSFGQCLTNGDNYVPGPMCEDAFAVYFDGLQNGEDIGTPAVHRIFIGTSQAAFLPSQGQPPVGTINLTALQPNGPRCYRLEAEFPWTLLVSSQGQPIPGKLPPAAGQTYGFDIGVSDFDASLSDANVFELQSQLFLNSREPDSELQSIADVGSIVLRDHSTGQTAQ